MCLGIAACEQEDEFWDLGTDFVSGNLRVALIDSFQLGTSTVLLDSLASSGTGQVLVGRYEDEFFGTISSSSYFQVAYNLSLEQDLEYIIDSMVLILKYSGYAEGDTTVHQHIHVHRLTEEIEAERDDPFGYLYNNSQFTYEENPLASIRFRAFPGTDGELRIRMPDSLAERWMEIITLQDPEVNSSNDFIDEFNGLVLLPDENDNASVLGFDISEDLSGDGSASPVVRIYYQEISGSSEEKTYDISLRNSTLQFNRIDSDREGTSLNSLDEDNLRLESAETGGQIFLQAGSGILPRLDFPDLESLYRLGDGEIINAELVLEPLRGSYSTNDPLPSFLVLQITDRNNGLGPTVIEPQTGQTIVSTLEADYAYQENTAYRFPITSYVKSILETDEYIDYSLFVGLPGLGFQNTVESLVLGGNRGQKNPIRLEIYYSFTDED